MTRRKTFLLAALAAAWLFGPYPAGLPAGEGAPPRTIKAIVYNVQFLPGPGKIANKRKFLDHRAARLGELLAAYDVVGLNEVFDDKPREILLAKAKEILGENYHAVVHPRPGDIRYNGGLAIVSRFPIVASHHSFYKNFSDVKTYGALADGHAAKGGLHARICPDPEKAPDVFIDVFTTHLEAREDKLRPLQYEELSAFIKEHASPGHPVILMGDMNTHGMIEDRKDPASQYAMMMKAWNASRPEGAPFVDVWPALMGEAHGGTSNQDDIEKGSRIDYVFYSNPAAGAGALKPLAVRVNPFPDPKSVYLSDHSAVEADFEWSAGAGR